MVIVHPYHRKGRARPWPISRRQSHPLHRTLTLTSLSVMVLVNEQTPCDVPTFASLPKKASSNGGRKVCVVCQLFE